VIFLYVFSFLRSTFAAIFGLLLFPVHLAQFSEKLCLLLVFIVALSLRLQSYPRVVTRILL
jgi:hypothetical protein